MEDSASLSVLLAHGERDARGALHAVLTELRKDVVRICSTGTELIQAARESAPDLIITGIDLPEVDGLTALLQISEETPIPAIVVTQEKSLALVEKALHDHVMAYLLEPVRQQEILPTIHLVLRRFEEFQGLHQEVASLKQALEDRKMIERAKGVLMQQDSIDEETAYKRLRRLATDHRVRLRVAAESILNNTEPPAPKTDA